MRRPIISPEGIRSGGFSGGASAGATRPVQGNSLQDLATALDSLSGTGRRYARDKFNKDRSDLAAAQKQDQENAELEAELFKQSFQGLTASEIQTSIDTDPRLKDASPFVLPILQNFQGYQQAQEDFARFTEENPQSNDPSAFRDWLKENGARSDNAFAAKGYNTEIARFESQFESAARGRLADSVVEDAKTVALGNFSLARSEGASVEEALKLTMDLWSNKESGFGLPRKGFNQIKMDLAVIASNMGDVELFDEIVSAAGSDGVPGLAANPSFMADVAKERRMATNRAIEIRKRGETETVMHFQEALKNRDNPMTLRQLRADPAFEALHQDTQLQLEGWAIAADNWRLSEAERKAKDAAKDNEELLANMRLASQARVGIVGRNDLTKAQRNFIFSTFRADMLDGNVTNPATKDVTNYISFISGKENRLVDPVFEGRFNAMGNLKDLDPAALREREQDILTTVEQWSAVPREFRSMYAKGENRGLLEYLSGQVDAGVPILDAVQQAQFAGDFSDFDYGKTIQKAAKNVQLNDGSGFMGMFDDRALNSGGTQYFRAWAGSWLQENGAMYLDDDGRRRALQDDFENSHVLVGDAILPIPSATNGLPVDKDAYRDAVNTTLEALPAMPEELKEEFGLPTIPTGATDVQVRAIPNYPERLRLIYKDPEDEDFDTTFIYASMIDRVAGVIAAEAAENAQRTREDAASKAAAKAQRRQESNDLARRAQQDTGARLRGQPARN